MKGIDELLVMPAHQLRGERDDNAWAEYLLELAQKCEQALNSLSAQAGETGLRFEVHSTAPPIDGEVVVRGRLRPEQVADLRALFKVGRGETPVREETREAFALQVWSATEALLAVGLDLRNEVGS